MLLGYDKNGDIKFFFTDDDYLKSKFKNNTAKISNFWKVKNHGLKELFIDGFHDICNLKMYKVINGKLVKQEYKENDIKKKNNNNIDIIKVNNNETKISKITETKDKGIDSIVKIIKKYKKGGGNEHI